MFGFDINRCGSDLLSFPMRGMRFIAIVVTLLLLIGVWIQKSEICGITLDKRYAGVFAGTVRKSCNISLGFFIDTGIMERCDCLLRPKSEFVWLPPKGDCFLSFFMDILGCDECGHAGRSTSSSLISSSSQQRVKVLLSLLLWRGSAATAEWPHFGILPINLSELALFYYYLLLFPCIYS